MGIKYLNHKQWKDITREERYFCAEFYNYIKSQKREKEFVKWLKEKTNNEKYDAQYDWEIAYEVCFYRDYLKGINKARNNHYPPKRTFDLCLFSEKRILIIEAKVQQALDLNQLYYSNNDREGKTDIEIIKELLGNDIDISIVLIASSLFINGSLKQGKRSVVNKCRDKGFDVISWEEINREFIKDIYDNQDIKDIIKRADEIYKK